MNSQVFTRNILEGVGRTPLLKLNRITEGLPAGIEVFAKLEFANPMGSIKDRIALHMITKAEADGRIEPGYTIIDNSSGNTALGLAMVCAVKGYRLRIVVRDSISSEKVKFLRALNVDVHMVDHTLPPDSPDSYNNITPRLAREMPRAFFLDQHNNRENNEAHYLTTGPEIWEQMEGKIDYFITGIGTGGTICGAGRFLKEMDSRIRVVAVDPAGSIFYDYFHSKKLITPAEYSIEGLGDEFLIRCVDFDILDDMYRITDRQAFHQTRKLALVEALLAGGSSGASLWAVLKLARTLDRPARIVTIFPDSANRYLSTIYNDGWLRSKGFISD
jgi:cystathionine beta-synthase